MSFPLETNSTAAPPTVHYRALCLPAVASVVVGVLSIPILVFWFSWFWAVVPLLGIALGWQAQQRIRQAPNEWTGLGLARLGIGLSAGLWLVGYGWLAFARTSEIPYGYERVSYEQLQSDPNVPTELIPQSALDMQDKRVFVKGYMQPRRQQTGIKEFVLCPSNGECPFCIPNPKKTEMIRVVLQGDLETIYTTHQIGVGGRFQVDAQDPSGIPYGLEVDYLR
jgi:hypothetical protein